MDDMNQDGRDEGKNRKFWFQDSKKNGGTIGRERRKMMIDKIYDFFYGNRLRKYLVLFVSFIFSFSLSLFFFRTHPLLIEQNTLFVVFGALFLVPIMNRIYSYLFPKKDTSHLAILDLIVRIEYIGNLKYDKDLDKTLKYTKNQLIQFLDKKLSV